MDADFLYPDPAFPIVVSGPSGVGKTVLCTRLCQVLPDVRLSVSATTRPPRAGERDGESYFFWSESRFREEIGRGGLAEWAEVHGHLYGTPARWLDEQLDQGYSVVLNIDVQGGRILCEAYPKALLVFVLPPSWKELERRLRRRGTDSPDEIRRRLRIAREEIRRLPDYHSLVVNDDLTSAVVDLTAVVLGERQRVARRLPADWRVPPANGDEESA